MNSYQTLSAYYDRFTDDVGYGQWADFFEQLFAREDIRPQLVLDLACGTGSLTRLLAKRGYDMIGCLDSVNYVTDPDDLAEAFRRVHLFLNPDGLFVFDINTPAKFSRIDGESYVREDDGVFCVWQAAVEDGLCAYQFDIFEQDGDSWSRAQETHEERVYEPQQLVRMLEEAGFTEIKTYGDQSFAPVKGGEDRIYFTARKRD